MLKKTDEVRGAVRAARRRGAGRDRIPVRHQRRREHRRRSARSEARRQRRRRRAALQHVVRAVPASGGDAPNRAADRQTSRRPRHERRFRACDRRPDAARVGRVGLASERLPARHAAARGPGARPRRAVLHRCGAGARHVSRRRSRGRRRLHDQRHLQVAARRVRRRAVLRSPRAARARSASIASAPCTSRRSSATIATRSTARRRSSSTPRCRLPRSISWAPRSRTSSASASTGSSVTPWRLPASFATGSRRWAFALLTPPDNGSSIVSVHLDRNQARAREVLDGGKVQVSFREKGSQIRVSPALFNTRDEIRRFLDHAKSFA